MSIDVTAINDAPIITTATETLSTPEEIPLELTLLDLGVTDVDNNYPQDFTLTVLDGDNYGVDGTTITPDQDYNGVLTVPVYVDDGGSENSQSNTYNLSVDVTAINDAPVLIEGSSLTTPEDTPLEITLSDLTVNDSDNNYPEDFTLTVLNGDNYSIDGTTITPNQDYNGSLSVPVYVDDGESENSHSNTYDLSVTVDPVNDPPTITMELQDIVVEENWNETISIDLGDYFTDPDIVTNGDYLTFSLDNSNPSLFEPSVNGNMLNVTIYPENTGIGELTVTAEDGTGETVSDILTVTVQSVMELNASELDFLKTEYGKYFTIMNSANFGIFWNFDIEWTSETEGWLTIGSSPGSVSAGGSTQVDVNITPTELTESASIYIHGYRDDGYGDMMDTDTVFVTLEAWTDVGPEISNIQFSPDPPVFGSDNVTVSASISSVNMISTSELRYNSGTGYKYVGFSEGTAVIPTGDITLTGVMFNIYAEDELGYNTTTETQSISVQYSSLPIIGDTKVNTYSMISVPGQLNDRSTHMILGDELGEYDPTKWRLFTWDSNQNDYVEHPNELQLGRSYWLITDVSYAISGGGGASTELSGYTLELSSGWNMIGNPYHFTVNLNSVTIQGDVENKLYQYNGSGYYQTADMNPGEGYWIWSGGGGSLEFDPEQNLMEGGSARTTDEVDPQGWVAGLSTQIGNFEDTLNKFGVHPEASGEKDNLDYHEPPVIGEYISLAFDNKDWDTTPGLYHKDVRPDGEDITVWNIRVTTNIPGIVRLQGLDISEIPIEMDVTLVDMDYQSTVDLRQSTYYEFTSSGNEHAHPFVLLVGYPDAVNQEMKTMGYVPDQFMLAQNTPNPFNPVTSIRLSLPEESVVSITVYNLLGEEITRLASGETMNSGIHRMIWNGLTSRGEQAPTGVYLYSANVRGINGKQYNKTRKMILIK